MIRVPGRLKPIAAILRDAGYRCYLVGGAVRDMLAGRPLTDLDLATDAAPQTVINLFHRVIPTGLEHGTVTILFKGGQYEITTFRSESAYSDGRHPDRVAFAPTIEHDLSRRDFTINGMALDVTTGVLLDPYGGRADIRRGVIRTIGDPSQRFREDGLRLMRAVRFAVQLEYSIDETTLVAMCGCAEGIQRVSMERIRDELTKMLAASNPAVGFRLLRQTRLLQYLLPELNEGIGVEQDSSVAPDVFDHLLLSLNGANADRLDIRLAALLHDIAKPRCYAVDENGAVHFHGHDEVSAALAAEILNRLRYPKRLVERVSHLIRHHMFTCADDWSDAAVRRFVARVGVDSIDDLLLLRAADSFGKIGRHRTDPRMTALRNRIDRVLEQQQALTIADLAVDGNDLRRDAGIPPGRSMGAVLRFLLDSVLEDPGQNSRDRLLTIAQRFYGERIAGPQQQDPSTPGAP